MTLERPLRRLDLTLPTPAEDLALDEALLLAAEAGEGGEVLRLWESPRYTVVLGAGGVLADEVDEAACRADDVSILRRASGGGTVLLGPGCLLFSLVLAYERDPALGDIHASYRLILERLAGAFQSVLANVAPAGTSDLAAGGRKFSGNSQQRKRTHLLHHGTLLYDFALDRIGRYLRMPGRQPAYREQRLHADFVQNLPCDRATVVRIVTDTWGAGEAIEEYPRRRVEELLSKYTSDAWTRRR